VKPVCQFGHVLVSGTYDSEYDVVVCVTPKMRRMGEVGTDIDCPPRHPTRSDL